MASGLLALLDDVAAIAKVAAASLDDVSGMAVKAGAKSAGVVIDDAAVTPRYVTGFAAARELPIVVRIARGSLRNKLLILLPGALLLSLVAPWAITPLLMLGGLFLCFEGAEKVLDWIGWHPFGHGGDGHEAPATQPAGTPAELEHKRVASAIKTDFILSAEIMAITLAAVPLAAFWQQALVLAIVGTGITFLVYGAVALLVKADDAGVALAARPSAVARTLGRGLVKLMPHVMQALTVIGTVAMLLVGGGIVLHGLEALGAAEPAHAIHDLAHDMAGLVPGLNGLFEWLVNAALSGGFGAILGFVLIPVVDRAILPVAGAVRRVASFGR